MATKKSGGSTKNGRDSKGRRLGLKLPHKTHAYPGQIIARQRGSKILPGKGVSIGKDHTLFAVDSGTIIYKKVLKRNKRNNLLCKKLSIYVVPDYT